MMPDALYVALAGGAAVIWARNQRRLRRLGVPRPVRATLLCLWVAPFLFAILAPDLILQRRVVEGGMVRSAVGTQQGNTSFLEWLRRLVGASN